MSKKQLSITQIETLGKMEFGKDYCAYDLQASIGTLDALVRRGYLTVYRSGLGALFAPRVSIIYRRVENE